MSHSPCRKPAGPYLIESSPLYREYLAAKASREIVQHILSPMAIFSAAISGYRAELLSMNNAAAIYLGTGK